MMKGLKTPFQKGHALKYGLKITERDEEGGWVRAVTCRFCISFGREAVPGQKRQRTAHYQTFTAPFRADSYARHMASAHPEKWVLYQDCGEEAKATFFDEVVNHASTLFAHFESEGALTLTFNRDIVEDIVGDLLFDPDDEITQSTRERALAIFRALPDSLSSSSADEELNRDAYRVTIKSVRLFNLVIGFVSKGASFRSAARFVDVAREVTKLTYLGGCSQGLCAKFIRVICAASLQGLHELLRSCWAYSIALGWSARIGLRSKLK